MEKCAVSLYGYCFFLKNAKALFVMEIVFSASFLAPKIAFGTIIVICYFIPFQHTKQRFCHKKAYVSAKTPHFFMDGFP